MDALKDHGVTINDLYASVSPLPESYHSVAAHYYTPEATSFIGDQVSAHIFKVPGLGLENISALKEDYSPDSIIGI